MSIATSRPEGAGAFFAYSKIYAVTAFITILAVSYLVVAFLFKRFDENGSPASEAPACPRVKQWLIIFVIIYICWLPWIISHYPGTMRDDSVRQLFQTFSVEPYQSANPLFDTWVFGLFWHLGDALGNRALGLCILGFVQSAFTAASFSCLFCYLTYINTRKEVVFFGVAAVSLLSFFPLAAMSMSKDGLNGWLFLLFAICFAEGCRTKGAAFRKPAFSATFILLSIATIITKATMLYVVGLSYLALLAFIAISKSKNTIRVLAFQGTSVVLALCITSFILPASMHNDSMKNLPEEQTSASATFFLIPLQQVGRALSNDLPIDEPTMQSIESYVDAEKAAAIYNPNRADEMT